MYEFEAVSVSSFEAASLAATLTERSADGWDVVSIVPAGSDVVAYLRRSTAAAGAVDAATTGDADTATPSDASAETPAADLLTPAQESGTPAQPAGVGAESGGAGWGANSADTGSTAGSWSGEGSGGGGWSGGGSETSSWGGSAQQAPTPSTPSVPAGWYADPAGRFELRYWDGNAWTEHVSRAGQQYTDPPVA
ncbi:MAG: DUF2510 domain-containing protein [Acidimicrobiales bacterium]